MTANDAIGCYRPGDLKQDNVIGPLQQRIYPDEANVFCNPAGLPGYPQGIFYVCLISHAIFPANQIQIIMRDLKPGSESLCQCALPAARTAKNMYFEHGVSF